jgi:hypothetical protein
MVRFHVFPTVLLRVDDRDKETITASWRVRVLVAFPQDGTENRNMLCMTSTTAAVFGDTAEGVEQQYVRDVSQSFLHFLDLKAD